MKRLCLAVAAAFACGASPAASHPNPGGAAAAAAVSATALPPRAARVRSGRDGLGEEVWRTIPATADFVQREPFEGAEPAQRTEFRIAYDATTLYVKVRAFDSEPDQIVSYLTRRDVDSPCDWIRVLIDSYHDRRTAYEFAVNPAGVKIDRYWFNDTNRDDSWDAVWDVTVARDSLGWQAEFRIPFSQLRFTPAASTTLGFAVVRQIGRLNETSTWPLLPRSANGYVSSFGEVSGLAIGAAPKRLELAPYTVANVTRQPTGGNPLLDRSTGSGAAGLDLKYALTPGLTLTGTVNPDFGQVEADPAVVNLTAFETYFSERRPFFVEGSGAFQFNTDCNGGQCTRLFYSRRIGRSPQGLDDLPSGDHVYTSAPAQSTILGAAKLTGRVGHYSIGLMQAVTQEEFASVVDGDARSRVGVEPLTSYSIARARREFANQSSVGFIATSTNRAHAGEIGALASAAYTGGVDWDLRFKTRYALTGSIAGSSVHGTAGAIDRIQENSRHYFQRPDLKSAVLDPSRTSLRGGAWSMAIAKIGGRHVLFNSNVSSRSPGYETNEVGFLRRADQRAVSNWLQVKSERPTRWFRGRWLNFNQSMGWNSDGDRLWSNGNVNASATFANNWQMGGGTTFQGRGFDDRVARGGPGVYVDGFDEGWLYVNSDNRRALSLNFFLGGGTDRHGSTWNEISPSVTYRPVPAVMITSGARVAGNVIDSQWVDRISDTAPHEVFGRLDQTTVTLTERINYTLTPNLSLQLYAEPFVSAGDYGLFKELADGRSLSSSGRYTPFLFDEAVNDNPDFNVKSFRTTNVLRWEYQAGSTLFIVWQQARENDDVPGGFRFGRDARGIFGVAPKNVFLVKLSYWLNY